MSFPLNTKISFSSRTPKLAVLLGCSECHKPVVKAKPDGGLIVNTEDITIEPVNGKLALRGKCRHCDTRFSYEYSVPLTSVENMVN